MVRWLVLSLTAAALASVGCRSTTDAGDTSTVRTDSLLVVWRDTARAHVAAGSTASWSSSDTAIATVDATGLITGVRGGTAIVTATAGGRTVARIAATVDLRFTDIAAGYGGTCGLLPRGLALCWEGFVPQSPWLVAARGGAAKFTEIKGSGAGTDLEFGGYFPLPGSVFCATTDTRRADCWGNQYYGALGDGIMVLNNPYMSVLADSMWLPATVASVAPGPTHSCAITSAGDAYCAGTDKMGELGADAPSDCFSGSVARIRCSATPVHAIPSAKFTEIATGYAFTCGLSRENAVSCWGDVPIPAPRPSFGAAATISLPAGVAHVYAGRQHACALMATGEAWCWGVNTSGQLGIGTADSVVHAPAAVAGGLRFTSLTLQREASCGLTATGDAYCWGRNQYGQVGDGTRADRAAPTKVQAPAPFTRLATGGMHACGLTATGVAYCWGRGDQGQLANGATLGSTVPLRVAPPAR